MANRSFGRKLASGSAISVMLTVLMGAAAVAALAVVTAAKDAVISQATGALLTAERLHTAVEKRVAASRGYLLTGDDAYLEQTRAGQQTFDDAAQRLSAILADPAATQQLNVVVRTATEHVRALDTVIELRRGDTDAAVIEQAFVEQVAPLRAELTRQIDALTERIRTTLERARADSSARATRAIITILALGLLAVLSAVLVTVRLSSRLRREVGATVGHIQSSSAELEAAAGHQARGGREQASAMAEITTTISELLITSRQIAESAQRVSRIAEETADAARTGDATIEQTRASISAIRAQVDQIVQHMLTLGEKSQQIGGVADLVSELAEQTNILAINATIEASGAGEWGRRFAVVAEEIRKLADRTAASAKEIRTLIDDVRGAVNTTVMATEIGAKQVDAGARQFDEATSAFRHIVKLVATTNDATREIELSTKQQASAVEQVNVAASDTARVTRETEASATQTRQTAAHLSGLSSDLLDLVGARDGA